MALGVCLGACRSLRGEDLQKALDRMVQLSFEFSPKDAWNQQAPREIVEQQRFCRYLFEQASPVQNKAD